MLLLLSSFVLYALALRLSHFLLLTIQLINFFLELFCCCLEVVIRWCWTVFAFLAWASWTRLLLLYFAEPLWVCADWWDTRWTARRIESSIWRSWCCGCGDALLSACAVNHICFCLLSIYCKSLSEALSVVVLTSSKTLWSPLSDKGLVVSILCIDQFKIVTIALP